MWETLHADAQELAAEGAAKIQTFKGSLRSGMVEGLAIRGGASATVWDSFITSAQTLGTDTEVLPSFGLKGSKKE